MYDKNAPQVHTPGWKRHPGLSLFRRIKIEVQLIGLRITHYHSLKSPITGNGFKVSRRQMNPVAPFPGYKNPLLRTIDGDGKKTVVAEFPHYFPIDKAGACTAATKQRRTGNHQENNKHLFCYFLHNLRNSCPVTRPTYPGFAQVTSLFPMHALCLKILTQR
jgi:hypothetical protein